MTLLENQTRSNLTIDAGRCGSGQNAEPADLRLRMQLRFNGSPGLLRHSGFQPANSRTALSRPGLLWRRVTPTAVAIKRGGS